MDLSRVLLTVSMHFAAHMAISDSRHPAKRSDDPTPLENTVIAQGQLIDQLKAELAVVKAEIGNINQLVAFMTSLPSTQDLTKDPRVKFGTPSLNIGGGFHSSTSMFLTPVSGLYVFFVKATAPAGETDNYAVFGLMKEGTVIADTETNDNDNTERASVQVVVQLTAGDTLWVQKLRGGGHQIIGGDVASTFGGFLIKAGDTF